MSTTGAARPEKVGCLILAGSDFPDSVSEGLRDWDISLLVAKDDTRLSSRGLLQYRGENFKGRSEQTPERFFVNFLLPQKEYLHIPLLRCSRLPPTFSHRRLYSPRPSTFWHPRNSWSLSCPRPPSFVQHVPLLCDQCWYGSQHRHPAYPPVKTPSSGPLGL